MLTLHARGSELERAFPFGVVRQLFEPTRVQGARSAASPARPGSPARCSRPPSDAEESSYARLHGLYWLCANLAAEQPLVVCIDDAQWADEPSLNFAGFLLRRLEDLPIALLIGTRPRAEQESDVLRAIVTDPATRVAAPDRAQRRRGRRAGCARRSTTAPATASAPPATRPPAATRSWSASCCTRSSTSG